MILLDIEANPSIHSVIVNHKRIGNNNTKETGKKVKLLGDPYPVFIISYVLFCVL